MNNTVSTAREKGAMDGNDQRPNQRQNLESRGWLQPHVNIVENNERYTLEAEMPGVGKDGLEILLEGNELTIVGRREQSIPGAELVYRESLSRDFRRTFELDPT